jgi:HAD superfamily hydrolase (TIGR01509 family)
MERRFFRGVVWDVDGTLIDSEPLHYQALLTVCGRYGRNVDEETNREMLGLSLAAVWDFLGAAGTSFATTREAWIAEILDYYVDNVSTSMARPGARDTVEMLAANGVAQAAVSTAERRVVMANLDAVGVRNAMQFAIGREDIARTKPDPDPYIAAAKRLALPPSQCVAVEDTPAGVASARAAGMFVVAFPNAMTCELDFSMADLRVEHLVEVPWRQLGLASE